MQSSCAMGDKETLFHWGGGGSTPEGSWNSYKGEIFFHFYWILGFKNAENSTNVNNKKFIKKHFSLNPHPRICFWF